MTLDTLTPLDVLASTRDQPFCAGVILCEKERVLLTLNTDGLPAKLMGSVLRVGGVGGGQEPGETISACALREAQEELGMSAVHLISSPVTYVHELDSNELVTRSCSDEIAPLLFARKRNPIPDPPYRPGLPTGPYLYFALYFARAAYPVAYPGDGVKGLLWFPLAHWRLLEQSVALEEVLQRGGVLLEQEALPRTTVLWMPSDESMQTVAALLTRHPELLSI